MFFFEEVFVMKKRYLRLAALTAGVLLAAQTGLSAAALSTFDAAYYAAQYPDVAAVCGNDEGALLRHYLDHGIDEGRKPSADGIAGDDELSLTEAQFSSVWSPVPSTSWPTTSLSSANAPMRSLRRHIRKR